MNTYFKIKMYLEYIIPVAIMAIAIVYVAISYTIDSIKEKKINKFFLSHGYERKLLDVPSVGNGAFYGWKRESDHRIVDDRDIKHLSLKEIKEKYD